MKRYSCLTSVVFVYFIIWCFLSFPANAVYVQEIVERINYRRDVLAQGLQPPMVLAPLTQEASEWIGYKGIDSSREADLKEQMFIVQTMARTCMFHPHKSFFDHGYFLVTRGSRSLNQKKHIAGLFIADTAIRILESLPTIEAAAEMGVEGLAHHVAMFCQRLTKHKDLALHHLATNAVLRSDILSQLESFSPDYYARLLTPYFIEWYWEIYESHPGRKWAGIEAVNATYLVPPPQTQVLNVTFHDGCRGKHTPGKGFSLTAGGTASLAEVVGSGETVIYDGVVVNTGLPPEIEAYRLTGKVKEATVEVVEVPLELQAQEATRLFVNTINSNQNFDTMSAAELDRAIATLRSTLGVLNVYWTLGADRLFSQRGRLKELLWLALREKMLPKNKTPQTNISDKDISCLFNEIIELCLPEEFEDALESTGYSLIDYAIGSLKTGMISYEEAISFFRKAEIVLIAAIEKGRRSTRDILVATLTKHELPLFGFNLRQNIGSAWHIADIRMLRNALLHLPKILKTKQISPKAEYKVDGVDAEPFEDEAPHRDNWGEGDEGIDALLWD